MAKAMTQIGIGFN